LLEALVAVVGGIVFTVWQARFGGDTAVYKLIAGNQGALYGALAAIYGALLGFAITSASIILGYGENPRMLLVRENQRYRTLGNVFRVIIPVLGAATVASLLALLLDKDGSSNPVPRDGVVATTLLAIVGLGRVIWVLDNVIRIVTRPSLARRGDEP
jgi:hypothetical protein